VFTAVVEFALFVMNDEQRLIAHDVVALCYSTAFGVVEQFVAAMDEGQELIGR
jgi:hypothetical protein